MWPLAAGRCRGRGADADRPNGPAREAMGMPGTAVEAGKKYKYKMNSGFKEWVGGQKSRDRPEGKIRAAGLATEARAQMATRPSGRECKR